MSRTQGETVAKLTVLILAGGSSRRMGQDKLWLSLGGVPLVERIVRCVHPLAGEVLFSANASERLGALADRLQAEGLLAAVVPDIFLNAGPLAGLHAGLAAARHELLLALAADMPFVNLALIAEMIGLAAGYDAVIPQTSHPATGEPTWEPLHALYRRTCLSAITARLDAGERRVQCFLPDVRVRIIPAADLARLDPTGLSFFNVNTLEDWWAAERLAADEVSR